MFKKIHVVVAVSALLLTACGQSDTSSPESAAPTTVASFPVTIENNGTSVTITEQPDAIISLSATATEILFAIDAGAQVIAVDDQSNFPAEAPISDLSGFTPNLESIVALSPDLVVVSFDVDGIVAALTAAEIPVLVQYAAATLDDTYLQIAELGTATGQIAKAEELTTQMKSDIDAAIAQVPAEAAGLTYFHELDDTLYSVTSATFIGSIYALAGLTNIADTAADAASGYPQLSPEFIVAADPAIIILADTKCCGQSAETVAQRPGFAGLSAVTAGNVIELDDDIASRWGPRTVDFVKVIVEVLTKVTSK
ncbi:MAG: ABC transporter substrate-binding protein [Actinobacteria bacterium]|nr:ABC transporter substrate-binding protein [Actinomycetota bacterium]